MVGPVLITPATSEPIALEEFKEHLGISDDPSQDAMLFRVLARARRRVESFTGLGLAEETWEQRFNACEVSGDKLRLYRTPVASITSITAIAPDGTSTAQAASTYYAVSDGVALVDGAAWPSPLRRYEALAIRFMGGASPTQDSELREAILKLAASLYAHRGDEDFASSVMELPPDIEELLRWHRPVKV